MATKEESAKLVDKLVAQLGDPAEYSFFIPDWEPVDSEQGIWWMRSQLWEGFYVAYKIETSQKHVFFKYWEFGENEPQWESLRYAT